MAVCPRANVADTRAYDEAWQCSRGCSFTSTDFNDVLIHERSAHDWPELQQKAMAAVSSAESAATFVKKSSNKYSSHSKHIRALTFEKLCQVREAVTRQRTDLSVEKATAMLKFLNIVRKV